MKIPELTPNVNVGAYYGNEENGQWQPNGLIIDGGVGGGVVGSGDAGVHRPPVYPVHVPRGHIPGYVMAGAYYPPTYPQAPPAPQDDFADYMWMENEEEFDKQVMQQLEEEALMEQCIEAMLEDEQRERRAPTANGHKHYPTTSNGPGLSLEETVSRSTLNPLAAEFVPTRRVPHVTHHAPAAAYAVHVHAHAHTDEKQAPQEEAAATTRSVRDERKEAENRTEQVKSAEAKADEVPPPSSGPPEVSAAYVLPVEKPLDKRPKDVKKDSRAKSDVKKTVRSAEVKKAKVVAVVAKSDTKVQAPLKKKEMKQVKSETKMEKADDKAHVDEPTSVVAISKHSSPPPEDVASGPKPINYAAAAKANKPKKPCTPPITEKTPPPKHDKPATAKPEKPKPKEKLKDKPVPRKNSAK